MLEVKISRKVSNRLKKLGRAEQKSILQLLKTFDRPFHKLRAIFRGDSYIASRYKADFYTMASYPYIVMYAEVPIKKGTVLLVTEIYRKMPRKPIKLSSTLKHI